jgi:septation ring formation regulator EzrA
MIDYSTLRTIRYDKTEIENITLARECERLKTENEDLDKRLHSMYDLFTEAADAGDKARAEATSLQDALDMERVSNEGLSKEAHALRAEVQELERLNTAAVNRCAEKQRELNQLTEHNKKELKEADIMVDILRADCCTLRQKLYVKSYPSEDLIKADKELDQFKATLKETGLKLIELAEQEV